MCVYTSSLRNCVLLTSEPYKFQLRQPIGGVGSWIATNAVSIIGTNMVFDYF